MRRNRRVAAITAFVLACCLGLSLWFVVRAEADSAPAASSLLIQRQQWGPAGPGGQPSRGRQAPNHGQAKLAVAAPLAACEERIRREPRRLPTIAIVGASYTAGTGPDNPMLSWAVVLARLLHWNAVIDGVPGAGFVRAGDGRHGPMARMLSAEGLGSLAPSVVIVQAGHDDLGVPPAAEGDAVFATLGLIHRAAPGARVALLTVFAGTPGGTPALRQTDHVIVTAAGAADQKVIIMDPLTGQWKYQHANGGLHPTAAGDAWIANEVLHILRAHGVEAATGNATTGSAGSEPVICDASVGVTSATGASA